MDTHQSTTNTEDAIRTQAYLLSEQTGHPAGMEAAFWTEAERLVNSHRSPTGGAPGLVGRKTTTAAKTRARKATSPDGRSNKVSRKPTAARVDAPRTKTAPAELRKPRSRKALTTNTTSAPAKLKVVAAGTVPAAKPKRVPAARAGKKPPIPTPKGDSLFPSATA